MRNRRRKWSDIVATVAAFGVIWIVSGITCGGVLVVAVNWWQGGSVVWLLLSLGLVGATITTIVGTIKL